MFHKAKDERERQKIFDDYILSILKQKQVVKKNKKIIRIRYTTIVVYYPPHNFKGVYGWMDVCIKKKSGLRQDGTPPPKKIREIV